VAYLMMHCAAVVLVHHKSGARLWIIRYRDLRNVSGLLRLGRWVFGSSLLTMTFHPINRVLISRYAGVGAVPVYEIAWGSSIRIRGLLESGFRALMPEASRLSTSLTPTSLRRMVALRSSGLRMIVRLALPLYGSIFLFALALLKVWMRGNFQPALVPSLRIMLAGSFASLLGVPAYYLLLGLGEAKSCFIAGLLQAIANFGLCLTGTILGIAITPISVSAYVTVGMSTATAYLLHKVRHRQLETLVETADSDLGDEVLSAPAI
jgi:O-antigen/teichoic acid export membrane protein